MSSRDALNSKGLRSHRKARYVGNDLTQVSMELEQIRKPGQSPSVDHRNIDWTSSLCIIKWVSGTLNHAQLNSTCLWRHVVWCAAESTRRLLAEKSIFAHAEVRDLHVTLRIQHHVIELQIPARTPHTTQVVLLSPTPTQCEWQLNWWRCPWVCLSPFASACMALPGASRHCSPGATAACLSIDGWRPTFAECGLSNLQGQVMLRDRSIVGPSSNFVIQTILKWHWLMFLNGWLNRRVFKRFPQKRGKMIHR